MEKIDLNKIREIAKDGSSSYGELPYGSLEALIEAVEAAKAYPFEDWEITERLRMALDKFSLS